MHLLMKRHYNKEGKDMKRSRHLAFTTQRGREQIRAEEQQAIPIYNAIAHTLRDEDVLRIAHNDFAYETDVLWLLHHLPTTSHHNDVEELLKERFTEQHGAAPLPPEQALMLKALAEDIWHAWSQYLQRHDQSAFAQAHSRARMRRFSHPMRNSR